MSQEIDDFDLDLDIDIESQVEKDLKAALLERHNLIGEMNRKIKELEAGFIAEHSRFSIGDKLFIDEHGQLAEYVVKREVNHKTRKVKIIEPKGKTLTVSEVSVMYKNGKSLDIPVIAYVLSNKEGRAEKVHYDERN